PNYFSTRGKVRCSPGARATSSSAPPLAWALPGRTMDLPDVLQLNPGGWRRDGGSFPQATENRRAQITLTMQKGEVGWGIEKSPQVSPPQHPECGPWTTEGVWRGERLLIVVSHCWDSAGSERGLCSQLLSGPAWEEGFRAAGG
uniref:Uncharacterized protein n=1 Tax=Calidris pygmaea TaxID=425635 RepID=A0A8C3JGC3_9CHAR